VAQFWLTQPMRGFHNSHREVVSQRPESWWVQRHHNKESPQKKCAWTPDLHTSVHETNPNEYSIELNVESGLLQWSLASGYAVLEHQGIYEQRL